MRYLTGHFDTVGALVVAYLWVTGGLGWAYQHESAQGVTLTPAGKAWIILASPFFSLISLIALAVQTLLEHVWKPVHAFFTRS